MKFAFIDTRSLFRNLLLPPLLHPCLAREGGKTRGAGHYRGSFTFVRNGRRTEIFRFASAVSFLKVSNFTRVSLTFASLLGESRNSDRSDSRE